VVPEPEYSVQSGLIVVIIFAFRHIIPPFYDAFLTLYQDPKGKGQLFGLKIAFCARGTCILMCYNEFSAVRTLFVTKKTQPFIVRMVYFVYTIFAICHTPNEDLICI
jgi:hypothetical protein